MLHGPLRERELLRAGHTLWIVAGAQTDATTGKRRYLAYSTYRLSRITVTLIWPG